MAVPATPGNERTRLDTLRALNILDTAPEERFDRLTRLARRLFSVPIALVSLVDENRQWFKGRVAGVVEIGRWRSLLFGEPSCVDRWGCGR